MHLLILLFLFEKVLNQCIKFNYTKFFGGSYIDFFLGSQETRLFHGIDQGLTVTWTEKGKYTYEDSSTAKVIKDVQLKFQKFKLAGKEIEETLVFQSSSDDYVTIENFPIVMTRSTKGYNSRVGGVALAFNFTDEKYSLVHKMKKDKIIQYARFGLIRKDNKNGVVFFGDLPSELSNKHMYFCNVVGNYANWACELSYVFFGKVSYIYKNDYYKNSDYSFFQTAEGRVLAPGKFINYLGETIMSKFGKKCVKELYGMNYRFVCSCSVVDSFPRVSFIFHHHLIELEGKELFEIDHGDQCIFLIQSNHIRDNNWIFGNIFLEHFSTVFDYEKKRVEFYSDKELEYIEIEKVFPWQKVSRIIKIVFAVLLPTVAVIIIFMMIKNRRKNRGQKLLELGEELK